MNHRPLVALAALAAATSPDLGRDAIDRLKNGIRDTIARDPMRSTLATVLVGSWLFYRAERGHNPKVKSYYDALVYVATNMSVGYADIFAHTPAGKTIGAALMTYGPAMTGAILDEPAGAASNEIVDRLDRILAALEATKRG